MIRQNSCSLIYEHISFIICNNFVFAVCKKHDHMILHHFIYLTWNFNELNMKVFTIHSTSEKI